MFGVIAAAGPRPLADYLLLVFAGLALVNVLVHPISGQTIGPAVAAAVAFVTLNSRITTIKVKHRIKRTLGWLRGQVEARTRPSDHRRHR